MGSLFNLPLDVVDTFACLSAPCWTARQSQYETSEAKFFLRFRRPLLKAIDRVGGIAVGHALLHWQSPAGEPMERRDVSAWNPVPEKVRCNPIAASRG